MLEKLRQLWRSNYVRLLEEEVSCLQSENGALMNSLLGTAGLDAQLAQTLATLAAEKRTMVTPRKSSTTSPANSPCHPQSFCNPHQLRQILHRPKPTL
jgi:hypothetical protein